MTVTAHVETKVSVELAHTFGELDRHAEAWDRLALTAPERMPHLSHAWVSSFLETCNPRNLPWYCAFAYRGDELVGVLPVVTALDELAPGLWTRFHRVRETSPVMTALTSLQPAKLVLRPLDRTGQFLDASGDLEAYESALSRSMRRDLRKARRRAEEQHRVEVEVVGGPEAARPDLLADFLRVEAAGWKGERGSAVASEPTRIAFYTTLTGRLARRGWLEWHVLRFDGHAVAAVLGVRFGTSLLVPKAGYDEALGRFSPGQLLYQELFRRAFSEDTVEVNFLTDRLWMHSWHMQQSHYHDVIVSPRSGAAAVTSRLAAAEPRRRLSRFAHRHPPLLEAARRMQAGLPGSAPRPRHGSTSNL